VRKIKLSPDGVYIGYITDVSEIHIFEFKTMDHVRSVCTGDKVIDFSFLTSDCNVIYGLAENGSIYTWNVKDAGEQCHFFDDGCVRATCLSVSGNGQLIACGSNTGIVNVYNRAGKLPGTQLSPTYVLENLTTSASFVDFSPDAQLMAFGSDVKHMAGRMLHCTMGGVFQNFPSRQEMFSRDRLISAGFSPGNAFFAFGASSGTCRLYRLNFFGKY